MEQVPSVGYLEVYVIQRGNSSNYDLQGQTSIQRYKEGNVV
jgi:hypothetical protein